MRTWETEDAAATRGRHRRIRVGQRHPSRGRPQSRLGGVYLLDWSQRGGQVDPAADDFRSPAAAAGPHPVWRPRYRRGAPPPPLPPPPRAPPPPPPEPPPEGDRESTQLHHTPPLIFLSALSFQKKQK